MKTRAIALAAAAALGIGDSESILAPRRINEPRIGYQRARHIGNNKPWGPTRAQKKRLRLIARKSRRYNLRTGA